MMLETVCGLLDDAREVVGMIVNDDWSSVVEVVLRLGCRILGLVHVDLYG